MGGIEKKSSVRAWTCIKCEAINKANRELRFATTEPMDARRISLLLSKLEAFPAMALEISVISIQYGNAERHPFITIRAGHGGHILDVDAEMVDDHTARALAWYIYERVAAQREAQMTAAKGIILQHRTITDNVATLL